MKNTQFVYTGCENLEVMSGAKNYNNYLISEVTKINDTLKGRANVLDFGAGSGTYAKILKENGIIVSCLEPDSSLQETLKKQGFTVITKSKHLANGAYDLVYSLNVFEHIEQDADEAKILFQKIKPGGKILIYVPAFQLLYSSMDRKVGHFRRYRKHTLERLLTEAGFEVLQSRYCDPMGFFAAFIFRFIGNSSGDISPRSIKIYDRLVFPFSRALETLTGPFFGKNVLIVARKNER